MNADQLKSTYDSSQPDPTNSSNLISDRMDGGVGDDILFGGKFGDTLKGGVGNDILDGGPAGSLPNGAPDWFLWQTFDAAMNDGNFSRYQQSFIKFLLQVPLL